jgi:hypothetical protein
LCGKGFGVQGLSRASGILFDDDLPLGYVCEGCLIAGPALAAVLSLDRATDLNDFVENATSALPGERWYRLMQTIKTRADYWEKLAARFQDFDQWPIREQPCP